MGETLDKVVRHTPKLAYAALPAFAKEDLGKHVDYIIEHDPVIAGYIEHNPSYRQTLADTASEVYKRSWHYLIGSKLLDSENVIQKFVGLTMDLAGPETAGGANALAGLEKLIALAPKMDYMPMYVAATGDYKALPYWASKEAAALIPFVGASVNTKDMYSTRAHDTFRDAIAKEFLAKVSKSRLEH